MLEWYVYAEDVNARRIEPYNVFLHGRFLRDCGEAFREWFYKFKSPDDLEPLRERIRRELQYYFWSKCEWEIVLSGWPSGGRTEEKKIDVYGQVMLNYPVFFNYLWEHRTELLEMTFREE